MKNKIFRPMSDACQKSYNHSSLSQNPISPNEATDPTNAIGYVPNIVYTISNLPSPNESCTGVDLLYFSSLSRPVIVISCGRHNDSKCYLQFPLNDNEYNDFIFLSEYEGGYSNASVYNDKVLFSGTTTSSGNTSSKIFKISSNGDYELLWTDPSPKTIRNGCFVKNKSLDFIICGTTLTRNSTLTEYYEYIGNNQWNQKFQFTTLNNYQPFSVGIYGKNDQILIGNRVNNSLSDTQFISSFLILNNNSILKEIQTFEPIVACYIGNIIPNNTQSNDYILISGGQTNIKKQSFLLTSNDQKILLGPIMNGRNVVVFDFMKNGLQDIFIVCITDPHILLLQTSIGYFQEYQIENTIGNQNGEARGAIIGHLYNNQNTIEIIITNASDLNIPNQIYSFQYPITYKPIYA